jgi:hypothetical protein
MDNTVVTSVCVGPKIIYSWSSRLSEQKHLLQVLDALVGADLPVSIVSSGEQLVPNCRVRAAVPWSF